MRDSVSDWDCVLFSSGRVARLVHSSTSRPNLTLQALNKRRVLMQLGVRIAASSSALSSVGDSRPSFLRLVPPFDVQGRV